MGHSLDEEEGWANWKTDYRSEVLDKFSTALGPSVPMLWVCGHFHGNMRWAGQHNGVPMHIRVTSSAGTPMLWDGQKNFTSKQAAAIGTKAVGDAFNDDIMGGDPANIGQRLQAVESRSGL